MDPPTPIVRRGGDGRVDRRAWREDSIGRHIIMGRQPNLLEVVLALDPACCFARHLNGGKQQCDQDTDDCDDHEQFNQGESTTDLSLRGWIVLWGHPFGQGRSPTTFRRVRSWYHEKL